MKKDIVILHGWGLAGSKYNQLSDLLKKEGYKVFSPDLPGFGNEPLKSESMDLNDYAEFVRSFIKKHKILNPIFIGHSFGGRIAIKYSAKYEKEVCKIILTGVPIIRDISFFKKIVFLLAFFGGKLFRVFPISIQKTIRKMLYFMIGEWDYYNSGNLREVFKKIINEDLFQYLFKIKLPIIFVWGEEDYVTPAAGLIKIKKHFPLAIYQIISNVGHKFPYEKPEIFLKTIKPFL